MEYLNIWEKLSLLFDLINNNYFFIGFLIISAIIVAINRLKLINNKKTCLLIMLLFVVLFSIILFYNNESLFKSFDSVSNLIFKNIYFPSIYVYLAIILISDVILLTSLFSRNMAKLYKNINITISFVINFIFLVLLNTIGKDNIDILSTTSLYTNSHIVSLIELTTSLFVIWFIILFLIAIINTILLLIVDKKLETEPVITIDPSINTIELEVTEKEIKEPDTNPEPKPSNLEIYSLASLNSQKIADVKFNLEPETLDDNQVNNQKNIKLEEEIEPVIKGLVFNDLVKKENKLLDNLKEQHNDIENLMNLKPIMPTSSMVTEIKKEEFNILEPFANLNFNIEEPAIEKQEEIKNNSKYTKEDYQLFNNILKVVKENNKNSQYITKDDALNINLLNKFSLKEYNLYKKMLEEVKG